jgi:predicted dehydrogenase
MAINRREFVQSTLGAAAALGAVRVSRAAAPSWKDIRIAVIGFNGRGRDHIKAWGPQVVALCDCDSQVLQSKLAEVKKSVKHEVDGYADYRKLLESKNIDAVSIATPNHTHSLIAIAAIQAGKYVYCEKPVSHNIWEGRQLVAAARKHNAIVQTGTQSRSFQAIQDAVAFVRSGELGNIRYSHGLCYKPRVPIGKSTTPFKFPEVIDKDLWLGPAADEVFYRPEISTTGKYNPHYDWHWDFNTGCGDLGNQGIHQMDIARWFLGEQGLAPRVISLGGRVGYDDAGNTPNTQLVVHDYPKAPLIFEVRGLPKSKAYQGSRATWENSMDKYRGVQIGNIVQCDKGYVALTSDYANATAFDNSGQVIKKFTGGGDHYRNFLEAVEANDRSRLHAEIREGHVSSALCHAGNVPYRIGKKAKAEAIAEQFAGSDMLSTLLDRMLSHLRANGVEVDKEELLAVSPWVGIDPKTENFVGNDDAQALRARSVQRKPFEVPDIERETAGHTAAAGA